MLAACSTLAVGNLPYNFHFSSLVCEDLGLLLECLTLQNGGVDTQKQVLVTIAARSMCRNNSEFSWTKN